MTDTSQAFLPDAVAGVLEHACHRAGLGKQDAEFMRLGQNILYRLPRVDAVVRISRSMGQWDDAVKEVAVSRWLEEAQFPAARIHDIGLPQPLEVGGHPVTFWEFLAGRSAASSEAGILGGLIRQLHLLPRPDGLPLPTVQPFKSLSRRIKTAPIPELDRKFLLDHAIQLETQHTELEFVLPTGVNHGDAHIKNVIVGSDGKPALIDFEAFCWGNHEWDLAKTATEARMGMFDESEYLRFADTYGYDITAWDGFPIVCAVLQLKMVAWLAQNVNHSAQIAQEYRKRIETLRSGVLREPWQGF